MKTVSEFASLVQDKSRFEEVQARIKEDTSLIETKFETKSMLIVACEANNLAAAELLLDAGANTETQTDKEETALYMASGCGNVDLVALLLRHGARVNTASYTGATALYVASFHNHEQVVELLIKNGADVNACKNNGAGPVYAAAERGHAGADANKPKDTSTTPLLRAAQNGYSEAVELLLTLGKATFQKKALQQAIAQSHTSCIDVLIQHSAPIVELSHCQLAKIPMSVFQISTITELNVAHNQLTEVPSAICALVSLEQLNVSHNGLQRLPRQLSRLQKLTVFDCSNNTLAVFPHELHVQQLIFDNNAFSSVYVDGNVIRCPATVLPQFSDESYPTVQRRIVDWISSNVKVDKRPVIVWVWDKQPPEVNLLSLHFNAAGYRWIHVASLDDLRVFVSENSHLNALNFKVITNRHELAVINYLQTLFAIPVAALIYTSETNAAVVGTQFQSLPRVFIAIDDVDIRNIFGSAIRGVDVLGGWLKIAGGQQLLFMAFDQHLFFVLYDNGMLRAYTKPDRSNIKEAIQLDSSCQVSLSNSKAYSNAIELKLTSGRVLVLITETTLLASQWLNCLSYCITCRS